MDLYGENTMITRRHFLKSIVLSAGIGLCPRLIIAQTDSDEERSRRFLWRVPKVHFETVKNELHFDGVITKEKDAKGVPLVYIFIGAVLIPYLAKALLALRREIVQGGVVIDIRGDEIDIDTDKSLPSGVIVIVTNEGAQLYERDEIGNPAELVRALMKGL
jgi:hypothetical protein